MLESVLEFPSLPETFPPDISYAYCLPIRFSTSTLHCQYKYGCPSSTEVTEVTQCAVFAQSKKYGSRETAVAG
jgi:hypothetical protein